MNGYGHGYLWKDVVLPERKQEVGAIRCYEGTTCCNHLQNKICYKYAGQTSLKALPLFWYTVRELVGTSSRDGAGVDLTVVPPAGPHCAAALLLGGVSGQDVVAEVGVVQVVVTLFPLLDRWGGWCNVSGRPLGNVSCRWTKRVFL